MEIFLIQNADPDPCAKTIGGSPTPGSENVRILGGSSGGGDGQA